MEITFNQYYKYTTNVSSNTLLLSRKALSLLKREVIPNDIKNNNMIASLNYIAYFANSENKIHNVDMPKIIKYLTENNVLSEWKYKEDKYLIGHFILLKNGDYWELTSQ